MITENKATRKEKILGLVSDAVSDLMYYDRKEDDDLPRGSIQEAIENGEITVDEMVRAFRDAIED